MPRQRRKRRITVSFLGPDKDHGHLRFTDFIRKLEELRAALRQTERVLTGSDQPSVYWRVVDLRHDSPATVVLEEVSIEGDAQAIAAPAAVVTTLASAFKRINQSASIPANEQRDLEVLEAYRALGSLSENHVQKMTMSVGRSRVAISWKFRSHLDKIIGPDEIELGSVTGMLEAINLHNTLRCNVYPIVGPKKVTCSFRDELKPQVIAGLDRYVRVIGTLRYKQWSSYPHAIDVSSIEALPVDADLPTLRDLRGISPNATGDMLSEDFIEAVRDGDW